MVIHVGIDLYKSKAWIFDSVTTTIMNEVSIDPIREGDIYKVDEMFQKLKTEIEAELGNVCICLESVEQYSNEIRKKFIESGKEWGFKNVELIDEWTAVFLNGLSQTPYRPKEGDVMWVFCGGCQIWKKIDQKVKFIGWGLGDVTYEKDLERISKGGKTPNLIITNFQDYEGVLYPNCQTYSKITTDYGLGCVVKARITAEDPLVAAFDVNPLLGRSIYVKIGIIEIMSFKSLTSVPLEKSEDYENINTESKQLKIFDSHQRKTLELSNFKRLTISTKVDVNGIWSVDVIIPTVITLN
uniref:Uncharacterized protein n=1 Tax=Panagrolaimus sp. ES5 TaxID=591445 RepID=A0AC34FPS3_9BILA